MSALNLARRWIDRGHVHGNGARYLPAGEHQVLLREGYKPQRGVHHGVHVSRRRFLAVGPFSHSSSGKMKNVQHRNSHPLIQCANSEALCEVPDAKSGRDAHHQLVRRMLRDLVVGGRGDHMFVLVSLSGSQSVIPRVGGIRSRHSTPSTRRRSKEYP